jgi:CheY-like chemotaxis protein
MNAAKPAASSGAVKPRVLVVDDDLDGARMLAALVRTLGHEVDYAINGYGAISLAQKLKPEVVFLDLALPDLTGWAVARALRARLKFSSLRIYAITGRYGEGARERSLAAGCDGHLLKPVAPGVISGLLEA